MGCNRTFVLSEFAGLINGLIFQQVDALAINGQRPGVRLPQTAIQAYLGLSDAGDGIGGRERHRHRRDIPTVGAAGGQHHAGLKGLAVNAHLYGDGSTQVASQVLRPQVDVMFAAIGGHFTMDPERAAQAVEWVNPKAVVPIHWGTYPILSGNPARLRAALEPRRMSDRVAEMKPGETRGF